MTDDFMKTLADLRPRLHRYSARMTGSAVDGEDVVQDVMIRALSALAAGPPVENVEGWLFRIAHNASLDFLRARARNTVVALADEGELAAAESDPDIASASFRTFLELPVLQRCAVILKDVLGHSVEEVAEISGCSDAAAKAALQRGRQRLRELAKQDDMSAQLPLLADDERARLNTYITAFRIGDFDSIRGMLAEDVRLDLPARMKIAGKKDVSVYYTRYAELPHWRFALGAIDGEVAILVFDSTGPMQKPAHFITLDWRGEEIATIRDFVFAPYAMEASDWVLLEPLPD